MQRVWYRQDREAVLAAPHRGERPDLATTMACGPLDELVALHDELGGLSPARPARRPRPAGWPARPPLALQPGYPALPGRTRPRCRHPLSRTGHSPATGRCASDSPAPLVPGRSEHPGGRAREKAAERGRRLLQGLRVRGGHPLDREHPGSGSASVPVCQVPEDGREAQPDVGRGPGRGKV
jgi:hypothetical protein